MSASNLVREVSLTPVDARQALILRIAASQHLRPSARLCEFLHYVADCAIREAPEDATEKQIGIRIFHRNPGYNSSEDSIVRTHARLLRQKLAAYFAEEGLEEELIVEIPKGHYLPVFRRRENHSAGDTVPSPSMGEISAVSLPPPVVLEPEVEIQSPGRNWRKSLVTVSSVAAVLLAVFLGVSLVRRSGAPTAVQRFWAPFFIDDPPLVIFSNALFVGDSKTGLRYAQTQQSNAAQPANYVDTYTGIGEVASVYALTTLFDSHHAHFVLKRSQLMTWDEAQARNLVFIGSVAENSSLRVLEALTDFTITSSPGSSGVVNHHPKPGEPAVFSRPDPVTGKDYAILALLPGIQPGKHILVFSGLTTFGTQAAVDYVCRPDSVAELLGQIRTAKGEIRPFEAVLETTIGGGVPLQTRLVSLRVH